jgi:pyruvate dehydrogenase E2 component (dihydrolipoamide acetyltransferase)
LKADVEAALQAASQAAPAKKAAAPQIIVPEFTSFEDNQVSNIRKVIAERLSYSKQNIPHYYVTIAVNVDNLIKLRSKLNAVAKSKISVNDMVIKAASLASVKRTRNVSSDMFRIKPLIVSGDL